MIKCHVFLDFIYIVYIFYYCSQFWLFWPAYVDRKCLSIENLTFSLNRILISLATISTRLRYSSFIYTSTLQNVHFIDCACVRATKYFVCILVCIRITLLKDICTVCRSIIIHMCTGNNNFLSRYGRTYKQIKHNEFNENCIVSLAICCNK